MEGNWHYPVEVCFGAGKVAELPKKSQELKLFNPLVVIDPFLLENDSIQNALTELKAQSNRLAIFDKINPNPTDETVEQGVLAFKEINADGVIVIGGGSALDTGKTIAFMSAQSRPLWDFIDKGDNFKRATVGIAKIIALPTTSGTGAEVGRASVIKNSETNNKYIIFHPEMQPSLVIADPALTLSVPKDITAHTALDAFAHCLEAYCAPGFHPMADGIALEGMRLIAENLEKAFNDGNNLKARSYLMSAAIMGATAFQKGLGAVHGLSHPVGARYNLSHGLLNAMFMPEVLKFNQEVIESKLKRLCQYLGFENKGTDALVNWLEELYLRLDLPKTLSSLGAKEEDAQTIAQDALEDPSTETNPKQLTFMDYQEIYLKTL